jgi:hypothetical protein
MPHITATDVDIILTAAATIFSSVAAIYSNRNHKKAGEINGKVQEISVNVNSRLDTALAKISSLEEQIRNNGKAAP